jgi:copper chaperone CopZ
VSCSNAVRATLNKLENVDQVDVDFSGKTATVTLKKGKLTKDAVQAAFEGSRYGVSSFKEVALLSKSYLVNVSGMT